MKHLLIAGLIAVAGGAVHAHGEAKARHGGIVQMAHDLGFELVVSADEVALYIQDHGQALNPAGISGKLSVLQAGVRSEAVLAVAGERLLAKLKLAQGAKVVASLKLASGQTVTVRFALK